MLHVLFFNEGNLGVHVMGQAQLDAALRTGLARRADIQARFAGLQPMGRLANAIASRQIEPLTRMKLDFHTLRWHVVQSLRTRRIVTGHLRAFRPDVVQVHSQSVALALSDVMGAVPLALSVDTTVKDWWSMPAWRPSERLAPLTIAPSVALERHAFSRAALVLAWTGWAKRAVEREQERARVVEHHPGLDLDRYTPAAHRARRRPRVLFIGGRFEQKGGEDLLAALGDDLGHGVDLDIVTPASVPARPGVTVHRLSHADPELLDLLQQADVLCLPTHGDASPWALVEAMACGTPVISTFVGGIPDILDHGRAGVLIQHGDRRALRTALQALLADSAKRSELRAIGRERCEQHYDARRQFGRLVEHLRAALRSGGQLAPQHDA
jgi:glycosyltransferase involved in cell wall biosynthesis